MNREPVSIPDVAFELPMSFLGGLGLSEKGNQGGVQD